MQISVFEAFKSSIQKVLDNFRSFVLLGLVFLGAIGTSIFIWAIINLSFLPMKKVPSLAISMASAQEWLLFLKSMPWYTWQTWVIFVGSSILFLIILFGFMAGYIKGILKLYDNNTTSLQSVFSCFHLAIQYTIGVLIYGIVGLLGMTLIIPGIFWFVRFSLFGLFMIDKNTGLLDSYSLSYKATKDHFWPIFCVWLIQTEISYFMDVPRLLNLFIVLPIMVVAYIFFYRNLTTQQS